MMRPLEFPPFPKETLGCACSNIARSPLVSTTCTVCPPDVVCVVSLELGQLLKKRKTVHTTARRKSPAILRSWSRMRVRISETIIAPCCNILASRRTLPPGNRRCRQESHACQIPISSFSPAKGTPCSSVSGAAKMGNEAGEDGNPKLPPVAGFGYPNASIGLRLCAGQSDLYPGRRESWENVGLVRYSERC